MPVAERLGQHPGVRIAMRGGAIGLVLATGIAVLAADEPVAPPKSGEKLLTRFDFFPAGATITPALLIADVAKGEAFDRAGLSKCDFILGFAAADGKKMDLWSDPEPDLYQGNLGTAARGSGAYLTVLKLKTVAGPDGKTSDAYEILQPEAKLILNPTPGDHTAAVTVLALVVTAVAPHSAAEELGLRIGDLVYAFNDGKTIFQASSPHEANEMMKREAEKEPTIRLQVVRCEPLDVGYKLRKQVWISYPVPDRGSSDEN
jgi:PDZ domain-containing protein